MNFLSRAVKEQPLGAIAIVVSLVPFIYDVAKNHIFDGANLRITCGTPLDSAFEHEDGFLFYGSSCLIANKSREPVSLASMTPVMLHGDYPYPLIGRRSMNPTLPRPYESKLGALFSEVASQFPVYLNGGEVFATDVVFFTSVGQMRHMRSEDAQCSESLVFDRLSEVQLCIGDNEKEDAAEEEEGNSETESPIDLGAYRDSAKEQIYRGYSYGFADYDGFGLEISLGDGTRYIVEADLTDVLGYTCDEDIRQLNCKNYGANRPRVIDIGLEPEYGGYNWRSFIFILAASSVFWLTFRLLFDGIRSVLMAVKKSKIQKPKDDTDD